MMHNGWDGGWDWGAWIVMLAMMLAFWGAVAWVLVTLIRHRGVHPTAPSRPSPATPQRDAPAILDERFARGELDEDDYRRRREILRGGQ